MGGFDQGQTGGDSRIEFCRSLGIESIFKAHELIVQGARQGVQEMIKRGLNAKSLMRLGYDAEGMKKLGYTPVLLKTLGYPGQGAAPVARPAAVTGAPAPKGGGPRELAAVDTGGNFPPEFKQLIAGGARAAELMKAGWTAHHCKKAGCSATDLLQLGFKMEELATMCGCAELMRAGFGPRELRKFFSGHDLKSAGFSAADMRIAGYSVRELLNLGYSENHIRTAGFSVSDLMREGLSKTTRTDIIN